jgi:hypothetical protein
MVRLHSGSLDFGCTEQRLLSIGARAVSISFPPEFIDHLPQMRTNVLGNLPDYDVIDCPHGKNGIYGGHFNIPVLLLLHDDIAG